jgi:Peptidase S24-like
VSVPSSALLRHLAREAPLTCRVRGSSMAPLLADGDRVEVAARRRYWPGDVLAFEGADGRLVVHRLVGYRPGRRGWRLVTWGDAAPAADVPVAAVRVLGRVVGGQGSPRVARVSPAWRLRALGRFAAAALAALARRARRLRGAG